MNKVPYDKPPLTYEKQLEQLQKRGLQIKNLPRALHLLENISYYRLSGYWYPLLANKREHIFKPEACFDTAFKLYCFDKELRRLVITELEKIEVAIRAKMTYILASHYGCFWFNDATLFSNREKHQATIDKIKEEHRRSDEEFIKAFRNKYSNPFPPSWMTLEITSFGTLSTLYKYLKPSKHKREIANYFGVSSQVFESWLHSIVYLRNVCAHHTRLWNRIIRIQPKIPETPQKIWLSNNAFQKDRTYFVLSIIKYLLQTVNPKSSFKSKLQILFASYPNVDIRSLDFPNNWETESLWCI